jgi:hypothetical protein
VQLHFLANSAAADCFAAVAASSLQEGTSAVGLSIA